MQISSSSAIYYTISFLIASEGLAILSMNPHLHVIKASENQTEMYINLAYNVSILFLLSFGLRIMSSFFNMKLNKQVIVSQESLIIDLAIMLGLEYYFIDLNPNMKASIFTLFLYGMFLKVISRHMIGTFYKAFHVISEGLLYSIFIILAFQIQLIKSNIQQKNSQSANIKNCSYYDFKNNLCI